MGGVVGYVEVSGGLLAIYKGVSGWREWREWEALWAM